MEGAEAARQDEKNGVRREDLDVIARMSQIMGLAQGATSLAAVLGLAELGRSALGSLSRRGDEKLLLALAAYEESLEKTVRIHGREESLSTKRGAPGRELARDLRGLARILEEDAFHRLAYTVTSAQWLHSSLRVWGQFFLLFSMPFSVVPIITAATLDLKGDVALILSFGIFMTMLLAGFFIMMVGRSNWIFSRPLMAAADRRRVAAKSREARRRKARRRSWREGAAQRKYVRKRARRAFR